MKAVFYLGISILTICVSFVVMAPASLAYRLVEKELSHSFPNLLIQDINGSIWHGSAAVQLSPYPLLHSEWRIAPLTLLRGKTGGQLNISATGLDLALTGGVTQTAGILQSADAVVSGDFINLFTLDYGLNLSGEFDLDNVTATFEDKWFTALEGSMSWTGGIIHIETPQQIHTVKLPKVHGNLSLVQENVTLAVTTDQIELIHITLEPTGWARVAISYAFMDIANLPLPTNSTTTNPNEPAILLEEKIFERDLR